MKRSLWDFNGGLHLSAHKTISNKKEASLAQLPKQLIIPLLQSIGKPAKAIVIPGQRVLKGEKIAEATDFLCAALHAPTSGAIREIIDAAVPHPSGLKAACIVIDPDRLDEEAPLSGLVNYEEMEPSSLVELVREAGIVGLGGASFPTAIKLNPGAARSIKMLVLNGAECEPYITCDEVLMRDHALSVIEGAKIILHMLGIKHCLIGVEENKPEAIEALKRVRDELVYRSIDIVAIPTRYPAGGEKQLIQVLTGNEVPSGKIPADVGVVCQNVGTAAAIYQAVMGGKPLTSRLVTVTGSGVREPQNFEALIGTPVRDLVAQCGGYAEGAERLIMGGPMMGFALSNDDVSIVKATNSILVLARKDLPKTEQPLPCIRCGKCAEVCPINLLPQQLYWNAKARNDDKAQAYNIFDCIECGCCDVVCPSHIPLVQYFRASKSAIRTKNSQQQKADSARERHEARLLRLENEKTERAARSKKRKARLATKDTSKEEIKASVERVKKKKKSAEKDALDITTQPAKKESEDNA